MNHKNRKKWSMEDIRKEILEVMAALNIDRMPTSVEIKKVTKNSCLINAIRRHGGFLYWSLDIGVKQSKCTTRIGLEGELKIKELLENKGYKVEKMSVKHPYDLLVNDDVKIDVKFSNKYKGKFGEYFTFNLEKSNPTCDLYIFICSEESYEKILIIPSKLLHQTQISVSDNSKYNIYENRWDYIEQFDRFYKNIS